MSGGGHRPTQPPFTPISPNKNISRNCVCGQLSLPSHASWPRSPAAQPRLGRTLPGQARVPAAASMGITGLNVDFRDTGSHRSDAATHKPDGRAEGESHPEGCAPGQDTWGAWPSPGSPLSTLLQHLLFELFLSTQILCSQHIKAPAWPSLSPDPNMASHIALLLAGTKPGNCRIQGWHHLPPQLQRKPLLLDF